MGKEDIWKEMESREKIERKGKEDLEIYKNGLKSCFFSFFRVYRRGEGFKELFLGWCGSIILSLSIF